jgi:hypothetical protein
MSNLEPRRQSGMSRRERERRAYSLVLATGGLTVLAVALVILAILGVMDLGPAIIIALVAAGTGFVLKRTLSP